MARTDPNHTQPVAVDAPATHTEPTAFERVPAPLRAALLRQGFTELTAVQVAAVAAIDAQRDLRISSQTGSGKTVAFGLALAPGIIAAASARETRTGPEALVIVPTRELAAQVQNELRWLFEDVPGVRVDSVTGGTNVQQERQRLLRHPNILVGTPGRLVDHLGSGALCAGRIRQVVLDEADQMLDLGFREDLEAILTAVPREGRRTHMLSATFPDGVRRLARGFQSDPLHVEGTALGAANADIFHTAHLIRPGDRYGAVVNLLLLAGSQRVLVFVATRADATTLAEKLADDGFAAMPLSGELAQAQRTRTLNAFRSGTVSVLVATDVAARGLDVPEVACVIHGDLPMDGEVYTHRSGRTGRAGRKGHSILLATPSGERRARRILADAGVDCDWQPVPGAPVVHKALLKRTRRRVRNAIEAASGATDPSTVDFARSLLEGRNPEQVVASLLQEITSTPVREPFQLSTPPTRGGLTGIRPRRGDKLARRPDSRHAGGEFTRFRVNWGFESGANPRRLLAAMCRRGGVSSRMIGAIDIDARTATFDVASPVAAEFERLVSSRDPRDPDQRIERLHDDRPAGGRNGHDSDPPR